MCGIVAVLARPGDREPPPAREIEAVLAGAFAALDAGGSGPALAKALTDAAGRVEAADRLLRGVPGLRCLLDDGRGREDIGRRLAAIELRLDDIEAALDRGEAQSLEVTEALNAGLVRLKDATWAVRHDRLRTAFRVEDLAGAGASPAAIEAFHHVQVALSALDRLEVRGRDSAGLLLLVRGHELDLGAPPVRGLLDERTADPLFGSGSVRVCDGVLCFVYKAAAEIGELGDNTRALRAAVRADELLRLALQAPGAGSTVLAHTRWASVGLVSEANAHPLASEETDGLHGPFIAAALNGDVDNYAELCARHGLRIQPQITTDAKVIPVLVSRMAETLELADAFRTAVASFDGSVAITAASTAAPDRLLCALRGSGQALYVGLAEDVFVVASEPYGLVEQCAAYLRMDGETPADPANPATRGQVVVLDESGAGTLGGIRRFAYDGTELPVSAADLVRPEITTRDIDRGPFAHYLLKELNESPQSFRKTIRGRIVDVADSEGIVRPRVVLDEATLPPSLVRSIADGGVRRVIVIGQGTAAVAARACALALTAAFDETGVSVDAMAATELSGFGLREDMSDTLIVAVSQSGTTADTNRTVDLVRSRGARVVSIVNRRHSDLTDRSDGVLYTSDGRDVEMAVPSTKAFYAQVAAGFLLAAAFADALGRPVPPELLVGLRELPDAMERVLLRRDEIAAIAQRHAPARRYWAVVGNGANRIAAEEVRIKLSELCYKSIACDVTEDKKHIDLSAEPLIVVCAAGLEGSNGDDVAKEVAIYRAHRALPIVIAGEDDPRFVDALELIRVPSVHADLAFVLCAMAGHLFGYEAAVAIDAQARLLREGRAAVEAAARDGRDGARVLDRLGRTLEPVAGRFFAGLRSGAFDGHLEASAAVRLASLLRYATGVTPLEAFEIEFGKVGTPGAVVEDLTEALTTGIDQLTRPIDAIKHQAKTVTVGISRADETLLQEPLVREVLRAGVARDRLGYRALRTLAALGPAVERVTGYTHYHLEGDVAAGTATIQVTDRAGVALDIPTRTESDPTLRGTKRRVATEREVTVFRGRADGRTLIAVPEVKGADVTGLALLHVAFHERIGPHAARGVLDGYRDRFAALRDAVTETEPEFREELLGEIPVADLLTLPINVLAERWRRA